MKVIKNAAVVGCLVISISVQAQKSNQNKRWYTPHKAVKSYDSLIKSEQKLNEYKSKDWRQGIVNVAEESKSAEKSKPATRKKPATRVKVPAPLNRHSRLIKSNAFRIFITKAIIVQP